MDLGDTLTFKSDLYDKPPEFDSAGNIKNGAVLVNAPTVALTITLPDGSTVLGSVQNPPSTTGKYLYDYTTSVTGPSGAYKGQWLFTLAGGKTTSYVQTFTVGGAIVTVDEAAAALKANGTVVTADDLDYLEWLTFVATDAIERVGPTVMKRTFTDVHDGGRNAIALRHRPVVSITSVTEWNLTLTSNDYVPNYEAGVLYRGTGPYLTWGPLTWAGWGRQSIVVTYVAGYVNPPPILRKVALNTIQGMWQSRQLMPTPGIPEVVPASMYSTAVALTQLELDAYGTFRQVGFG